MLDRWYVWYNTSLELSFLQQIRKNLFEKYEKQQLPFFINHIHFSYLPVVVSIVCLGMQIQGRKLHNQDIAERSSSRACSS